METDSCQRVKVKIVHGPRIESIIKTSASLCRKGKPLNIWNDDDLRMDRRYDRSSQGDGFEGFYKSPGNRKVLKNKSFKVKNSNNFRICKQVENNVVSQGRASNYVNLKGKRFYLVLKRVEI